MKIISAIAIFAISVMLMSSTAQAFNAMKNSGKADYSKGVKGMGTTTPAAKKPKPASTKHTSTK